MHILLRANVTFQKVKGCFEIFCLVFQEKQPINKRSNFKIQTFLKFELLFGGGKPLIRVIRPFLPACPWSCICNFCLDNVLAISTAHFTMLVCMQIHFGINRHKIEIGYF